MPWLGNQQLLDHHLPETGPIMIPVGVLTMGSDMSERSMQTHKEVLHQLDGVPLLFMCIAYRLIQGLGMLYGGGAQYRLKCISNSMLSNTGTFKLIGKGAAKKHCSWPQRAGDFKACVPV